MGKHKSKSKKHRKEKIKKDKRKRKHKSSSSDSSEEEVWVEKESAADSSSSEEERISRRTRKKRSSSSSSDSSQDNVSRSKQRRKHKRHSSTSESSSESEDIPKKRSFKKRSRSRDKYDKYNERTEKMEKLKEETSPDNLEDRKREDWMNLSTTFLSTSNLDRRRDRELKNKLERDKQQYNPRECSRELNPYWKDGGDGLPKFQKPQEDDNSSSYNKYEQKRAPARASGWRKKKDDTEIGEERTFKPERNEVVEKEKATILQNSDEPSNTDDTVLTEKELNVLAAKLVKAEIMGNTTLVNELKQKLDSARKVRENAPKTDIQEIILTHTDSQGRSMPLKTQSDYGETSGYHKRKKKVETHKDGQRVRYFADDDKYSLKQMFENEKYHTVEDQNSEFIKMAGKIRKNDDLDEIFSDNIRKKDCDSKTDAKRRDRAINEHQKISKSLDNCTRCIQSESMPKHLMVTMGETVYLSVPSYEPLTEGHCHIIPVRHVTCSTQLDENEWAEILDMRKSLIKMFKAKDMDVIFFESAMHLHRHPHMYIECIPLPQEHGDKAPIYFKKAIDESETEWAQNKKLVSLKDRDVRRAIPKGLPYFFVSFGMQEGYAHVIEDEKMFPSNFAQEIVGGMMDLHHSKWRKPKRQSFDEQSKRVVEFSKKWARYDYTVNR